LFKVDMVLLIVGIEFLLNIYISYFWGRSENLLESYCICYLSMSNLD